MKFYSPLRYPGGKTSLASFFKDIIDKNFDTPPIYVEPYAGGAGAALSLLFSGAVKKIVINDLDPAIYSFWKAITDERDNRRFIKKVREVELSVAEWKRQKEIYRKANPGFELGFATFYLNRTNRSGVMNGSPIGGMNQTGNYKIDARFNKKTLVERVKKIGERADDIIVTNDDGILVLGKYLKRKNVFIYLDPPYYKMGSMLYMNSYEHKDHVALADVLNRSESAKWLLTYDETKPIRELYSERDRRRLTFSYRVRGSRKARELLVRSPSLFI